MTNSEIIQHDTCNSNISTGINPHLEAGIKSRLNLIMELVKEDAGKIDGPVVDARMGNRPGAFKAYCNKNGAVMFQLIVSNIDEYEPIVDVLASLSPKNFSCLSQK